MAEQSNMRASDADRLRVAEHLRRSADEGRLLAHEFDDRLGQALDARTYGELDAIVADLPFERDVVKRPGRVAAVFRRRPALIATTAVATAAVVASLASLAATGVRSSQPAVRPPLASMPTLAASPRPAGHRRPYGTPTLTVAPVPPRAPIPQRPRRLPAPEPRTR